MVGTSRAYQSCKNCLEKARKVLHPDPQLETVHLAPSAPSDSEEIADEDEDDFFVVEADQISTRFVAMEESGEVLRWIPNCGSELDEAMPETINTETDLESFASKLQRFHNEAVARKKLQKNDRSRGYTGRLTTTQKRHLDKRMVWKQGGNKLISELFPVQPHQHRNSEREVIEVADDSSDEVEQPVDGIEVVDALSDEAEQSADGKDSDVVMVDVQDRKGLEDEEPSQVAQENLETDARTSLENVEPVSQPPDQPNSDLDTTQPSTAPSVEEAREALNKMRAEAERLEAEGAMWEASERALSALTWRDWPALQKALEGLSVKAKDKRIDILYRARLMSMVATLNLFLDIHFYLSTGELPIHCYRNSHRCILDDEDCSSDLQTHLLEKASSGYFSGRDVVEWVESEEVQKKYEGKIKKTIHIATAHRWLKKLDWRFGAKAKGMYVDGHEREDIVEYRKGFVRRWKEEYELRMVLHGKDGEIISEPHGFLVPQWPRFRLILVTHDESTFFARDRRKLVWNNMLKGPEPERKGEGESIMISDFLTPEFGRLKDGEDDARLIFEAGKNRDGYFTNEHLMEQTSRAIDVFEARTNRTATGLFLFDNAPSHQKRAADALTARSICKRPSATWTPHPGGPKMRNGFFADGSAHDFYFASDHPTMAGWFKGSEQILREQGLFHEGLLGMGAVPYTVTAVLLTAGYGTDCAVSVPSCHDPEAPTERYGSVYGIYGRIRTQSYSM
ncbi:unnamed protein product [Mycena citricolor]|uniref:Uncharacterized protein n=1 Tax=Mycena citricolor TaxID=2018698 RepID=A0AAD2Q2Z5_9AGAR|nr:unnamed protein product [Mycena citricolor]